MRETQQMGVFSIPLIQGPPVAYDPDRQCDGGKEHDLPKLKEDIFRTVAFEQDAPHDSQKMGEGQHFADRLRPSGHAAKGEHEPGEQHVRQKEKDSHLHGLALILATVEKVMPTARFATMNTRVTAEEQDETPDHGHVEEEASPRQGCSPTWM